MVGATAHSDEHVQAVDVRAAAARLVGQLADEDESVVIYDAAGDSTPTVLPFMLGASLAQGRQHVNIVVSGLSDEEQGRVIEALHLEPVRPSQPRSAFRGAFSNRVRVYFVPLMGESNEFGTTVERARRVARCRQRFRPPGWSGSSSLTKRTTRPAVRVGQEANAAVLVSRLGSTKRSSIADLLEMAERFDCRVIGSVTALRAERGGHNRVSDDLHVGVDGRRPRVGAAVCAGEGDPDGPRIAMSWTSVNIVGVDVDLVDADSLIDEVMSWSGSPRVAMGINAHVCNSVGRSRNSRHS